MKNLHKIQLSLLIALALVFNSCEDFLEREPRARYTQDSYPAGGGLSTFVYAMYSDLRTYNIHAFPFVGIVSIRSDDADKGSTPADGATQRQLDDFDILPSNGLISSYYAGHYTGISKANLVLEQAEIYKPDISEEDYNTSRGEAYFIRAYLYFNLVRAFGGVPKVTQTVTADDSFIYERATEEVIYELIEDDLLSAIANLPESWDEFFKGRAVNTTAEALLAKVYLYQERWSESLTMSQNVIASGKYSLASDYGKIFTEEGELGSGSIFEVQTLRNEDYQNNDFTSQYGQVQGVRGSGEWNLGWGFNVPSEALVAAYEEGDPRMDATILFGGETTPYGEVVPLNLPNPRYNQKVYTNPSYREAANAQSALWTNIRILRYADVLLMAAEAANELGQTAEALEKLEMVRARARGSLAVLPEVTTTDQGLLGLAIQQERRVELAMEHERFYDLVRWGIAKEALDAVGKTNFVVGKHELLPIPQSEIDVSGGLLTQNPGY